ncbi:hypothetical protein [Caballeronia sp. LZ001]|uniref:hypothetical protein n=1 Tax=Caballeronia sp. LZ001 TaxID=3038553 RepID=UPI0028578F30|nr:hypothetical protein [Caballeronia sp. LZ001]MDR5802109.1 hypothetical protein [Caballeronia sp. LZ001]
MFVAILLFSPIGIAALFAFAMFADRAFHDQHLERSGTAVHPETPRRMFKLRSRDAKPARR